VIAVLEFGAWTKSYYLWEDDTTEMAERWIRRNVPAGSYFGKEWFSPSLRGRDYSYPTFNRPYLFARDFPPYSRFDYLLISSAAYGHFFKNEKFYSEPLSLYRSLPRNNELVKDFYFKDIEYSNPELKLFRTKTATKRRQRLALPLAIPLNNPEREFESVDGSPYGKSTMSFFLKGGDIVKRSIISRKKIANLAVFVSGADADGEVVIRNFGRTRRIRVRPGRPELAVFRPRLSFPFYHNIYKVSVRGTESLGSVFVRLCYDEFEIGSEFFARSDWEAARSHFLKALEEKPYSATDLEIYLYLATCCQNLGLSEDARQFLAEAKAIPSFGRFLGLFRDAADEKAWRKDFEKFSGFRLDLFESLQANLIQASEFERLDAREGAAGQESETGAVRTASAVRQYYPQAYKIEAEFLKPSSRRGAAGELEIVSKTQETEERQVFPLELNGSPENPTVSVSLVWENRTAEAKTQFIMKTSKDKPLILQQLKIYPDVRRFFGQKEVWVRRLLDSGAGSASEVP
jgi:tetratricopeptide (TPR) repeat protein